MKKTAMLVLLACLPLFAQERETRPIPFCKGHSWGWAGRRGSWAGHGPRASLKALRETGATWVALAFATDMPSRNSPEIPFGTAAQKLVTDDEIRSAVAAAREQGLRVMLKPVVNCADGAWRGTIRLATPKRWDRWWKNYIAFLRHYAELAQCTGCDMFCVGCEMNTTERFESRWRTAVAWVRQVYAGPVVYNANHGRTDRIPWWDAVDVIGVSAYYPVGTVNDRSLETMLQNWQPLKTKLSSVSRRFSRPVMFVEIGMRSVETGSVMPWDWRRQGLAWDGGEQARYYEAALRTFFHEPWFKGFFWWDWPSRLYPREKGKSHTGFCAFGKPAEDVLRRWYRIDRER